MASLLGPDRNRRRWATALLFVAIVEAGVAALAGTASGVGWTRLTDLFVVTNLAIAVALAAAGWPIAYARPRNPVGWHLLAGGCCYALTAAGVGVLAWAASRGWYGGGWRALATATNGGWTWTLASFLPLALLRFPDGRWPGRRWRWLGIMLVVNGVSFTATGVLAPGGSLTGEVGIPGYPNWTGTPALSWLESVSGVGILGGYLGVLPSLVVRYRRGGEQVRRQLLWLLFAVMVVVVTFTLDALLRWESLLSVVPLLLVPMSVTVAVLRYQVLDIRLVISRSVLYALLTAGVAAGYLGVVSMLGATVSRQIPLNASVLATLVIAFAFNPARLRLQRTVDRALYGMRQDPVRALAVVGARLGDGNATAGGGLDGVLEALCRTLRLPAAAVTLNGSTIAAYGQLPTTRHAVALNSGDAVLGELVVGLRPGEFQLDPADAQVLSLLSAPIGVAVHAGQLADALQISRRSVISGREEERRRLRGDLHDGLGPVLTGVLLRADAAQRLIDTDPVRSASLLTEVRDETMGAIEEIRRLASELRPPALDGMSLLDALREYASGLGRRADGSLLTGHG